MPACESKFVFRSSRKVSGQDCICWVGQSLGHMPRLVGDRGRVLEVLGWALTRILYIIGAPLQYTR